MDKQIVLSGSQPTGRPFHLEELFGPLAQTITLQQQADKEYYFLIANWHALKNQTEANSVHENTLNAVVDYLAAGLDPERCTIFVQSMIPETAEIALLLSNCISFNEISHFTAFKDMPERQKQFSAGFVFHPVLMAADILGVKADMVPVNEDQRENLKFVRNVARQFNSQYEEIFPEPKSCFVDASLDRISRALTSRMLSKGGYDTICLDDTPDQIWDVLSTVGNDPARSMRSNPGNPTQCNVFTIEEILSQSGNTLIEDLT